jgi:hypothetical protein
MEGESSYEKRTKFIGPTLSDYINGYWDSMSAEVLAHVFSWLGYEDLVKLTSVCKYWRSILDMVRKSISN